MFHFARMGDSYDPQADRLAGGLFHMLRLQHKRLVADSRRQRSAAAWAEQAAERARLTRIAEALSETHMCNRYADDIDLAILRDDYGLAGQVEANSPPVFIHPGSPGRVVTADRWLRQMHWGFPFAPMGKKGVRLKPKPVNNARTDKLATGFWSSSFKGRRCLIPLSRFCEAEGPAGSKTETWYSGPGPMLTAAGVWRDSVEWGRVYSMVMTESAAPVSRIHDRMPVILARADYATWLDGEPDAAFALCRPTDGLIEDRTDRFYSR